jgi:hypothetical protein
MVASAGARQRVLKSYNLFVAALCRSVCIVPLACTDVTSGCSPRGGTLKVPRHGRTEARSRAQRSTQSAATVPRRLIPKRPSRLIHPSLISRALRLHTSRLRRASAGRFACNFVGTACRPGDTNPKRCDDTGRDDLSERHNSSLCSVRMQAGAQARVKPSCLLAP